MNERSIGRLCVGTVVQFSHTRHHDSRANEQEAHEDVESTGGKQRRHDWDTENARVRVIFTYLTDHFRHHLSTAFDGS